MLIVTDKNKPIAIKFAIVNTTILKKYLTRKPLNIKTIMYTANIMNTARFVITF